MNQIKNMDRTTVLLHKSQAEMQTIINELNKITNEIKRLDALGVELRNRGFELQGKIAAYKELGACVGIAPDVENGVETDLGEHLETEQLEMTQQQLIEAIERGATDEQN
jgi:hypothetical protein